MKRDQQHANNQSVVSRIEEMLESGPFRPPSYARAVATLNAEGYLTGWGRPWTRRALYRMLQREGIAGIHDLHGRMCEAAEQ